MIKDTSAFLLDISKIESGISNPFLPWLSHSVTNKRKSDAASISSSISLAMATKYVSAAWQSGVRPFINPRSTYVYAVSSFVENIKEKTDEEIISFFDKYCTKHRGAGSGGISDKFWNICRETFKSSYKKNAIFN